MTSGENKSGSQLSVSVIEALTLKIKDYLAKLLATPLEPGLYLVSTPIGNLTDITLRALSVLARADHVFCEDTRHSRKLFSAYGLNTRLQAYHDFSTEQNRERILKLIASGEAVALISDAGTPLIADPGFKLVRASLNLKLPVYAVPGPSALLTALTSSGLETDRFHFCGFLPAKASQRSKILRHSLSLPGTIIFYETAARLNTTLEMIQEIFPDRLVCVARELTKLYEETRVASASEILKHYKEYSAKGEIVLLIGPGVEPVTSEEETLEALKTALKTVTLREAVENVAKELGVSKKKVYNLALKVRTQRDN